MKEAIGNSFVFNFVILFFVIFIFFFVGSLTYTKAFKVKNKIIDTIEIYEGNISSGNIMNSSFQSDVDKKLSEIGYRISNETTCKTDGRFGNGQQLTKGGSSNYRYCVYRFETSRGNYYGVVAYMYFEVPIIGTKLELPIYGETKIFSEFLG